MGFEPTTLTLARLHSTTELFPRIASYIQEVIVCQGTIPRGNNFFLPLEKCFRQASLSKVIIKLFQRKKTRFYDN